MENLEKNKAKHPHHRMFYDYYERDYYSQKVPIILNIHNFLDIPELSKLSKAQPDIPDQPKLQKKFHLFIAQQEISRFDGYPLEFFKRFWQVISPLFNIMVKGIKLSGLTPAHINTLLPMTDKDLTSSYRPLSLTNYDLKIISKTPANRLETVISSLTHSDQTGFIKHRQPTRAAC